MKNKQFYIDRDDVEILALKGGRKEFEHGAEHVHDVIARVHVAMDEAGMGSADALYIPLSMVLFTFTHLMLEQSTKMERFIELLQDATQEVAAVIPIDNGKYVN